MKSTLWLLLVALVYWFGCLPADAAAETQRGSVVTEHFVSTTLQGTRTGVDPNRAIKIYLPPGYASSGKSYPVIYYCHSVFLNPDKLFADGNLVDLLDRGIAQGRIPEFIFVVADYSSPTTGSIYENSPATGRWLDFTIDELIPFIDGRFRTLRARESRGVAGDMMGGRGAFQLAMLHPDHFSAVYALNPVATGLGLLPMPTYPDWRKIHAAKSFGDLSGDHIAQIFVTASQAFLPNPDRPPFYCDFIMEMKDGQPTFHPENALKLRQGFLLDHKLDDCAANLRTMRGIAFDWSRYDPIQDHVYASEAFSRTLESYGVEHEAEEYRGIYWTENWAKGGRFATRLLPFFARHLVFQSGD